MATVILFAADAAILAVAVDAAAASDDFELLLALLDDCMRGQDLRDQSCLTSLFGRRGISEVLTNIILLPSRGCVIPFFLHRQYLCSNLHQRRHTH